MPPKKAGSDGAPMSKIHRKIMLFFSENQGSIDTPRGIAAWINESLPAVRKALEELVSRGYLRAHRTSSTVAYSCPLDRSSITKAVSQLKK